MPGAGTTARGRAARLATNYDGLVISVLAEAQADGAFGRPGVRGAATVLADRWAAAGTRTGRELGFEVGVLTEAIGRQTAVEAAAGPGTPLPTVTEPTETATAAAFAHTAVLAGQPANEAPLAEAGRLFGRIAHLVDAVEDLAADQASGAWNPLLATGTDLTEARRLCDDALLGIKLALNEAEFTDARLVHTLLVHELARSVRRVFAAPSAATGALAATAGSPGCGLPAAAGLSGLLAIRRRRGCCEDCCCDCGEDCSCDCCGDACCGDGCCDCSC